MDEEEIETRVEELRVKLLEEMKKDGGKIDARGLKPHQVHELAAAKLGGFSPLLSFFFFSLFLGGGQGGLTGSSGE